MRIGISTDTYHGFGRWGAECYKKAKLCGFTDTDFRLFMQEESSPLWELSGRDFERFLEQEKKLADASGISVYQTHAPWRCPPRDETAELRAERLEKMKKSLYGTAILGAEKWIVHPLMPCGLEDEGTDDSKRTFDINFEFLTDVLKEAKPLGITVCFENMPFTRFSLSKPGKILELVRAVDHEYLKICFDTGHVAVFRELCAGDEVRKLGAYIKVLHIHDNGGERDEHLYPFEGITDWENFASALSEINYDGVVSLECGPSASLTDTEAETEFSKLFLYAKKLYNLMKQE